MSLRHVVVFRSSGVVSSLAVYGYAFTLVNTKCASCSVELTGSSSTKTAICQHVIRDRLVRIHKLVVYVLSGRP